MSRLGWDFPPGWDDAGTPLAEALCAFATLPRLQDLHLTRADFRSGVDATHRAFSTLLPQLRDVHLGGCEGIGAPTLRLIADRAPRLRTLAITCHHRTTSRPPLEPVCIDALAYIATKCMSLQTIRVHSLAPPGALATGSTTATTNFHSLTRLEVGTPVAPCQHLNTDAFVAFLDRCSALQTLKILGSDGIAEAGLAAAVGRWHAPRGVLDLTVYAGSTEGLDIAAVLVGNPSAFRGLQSIWVGSSAFLADDGTLQGHIPTCTRAVDTLRASGLPVRVLSA